MSLPLSGSTVPRPVFKRLQQTSAPPVLPLDLAILKAHLRITHTAEDSYLSMLIGTATEVVERYLSRKLITRTMRMWMDLPPGAGNPWDYWSGIVQLPISYATVGAFRWFDLMQVPVAEVVDVRYVQEDGTEQVFDVANYLVDNSDPDMPARIILVRGATWPSDLRIAKSLLVNYSVGYGVTADAVPTPLRHGVLLVAAALWSNRGDNADPQSDVLGLPGIQAVLEPFRVMSLGGL